MPLRRPFPALKSIFSIGLYLLLLSNSHGQSSFIDELPFGFKLGVTKIPEAVGKGFIKDDRFTNKPDEWMYKLSNEDVYAYFDTATTVLVGLKIWKMPDIWVSNGLFTETKEKELVRLLNSAKIEYQVDTTEYDHHYTVVRSNLDYWFCVSQENNIYAGRSYKKGKLTFVSVTLRTKTS